MSSRYNEFSIFRSASEPTIEDLQNYAKPKFWTCIVEELQPFYCEFLPDFSRKLGEKLTFFAFFSIKKTFFPGRWKRKQYSVNFRWKPSGNLPFPAGTRRKMPGIRRRNPVTVPGCRFWQFPVSSERNRMNPVTGSVHRNTASIKSPEYHGTGRFRAGLSDLGKPWKCWF